MRPLDADLLRGEKKGKGASQVLDTADKVPGMEQIGLAHRKGFHAKASVVDAAKEDEILVSVPVDNPDELAAFEDATKITAILSGDSLVSKMKFSRYKDVLHFNIDALLSFLHWHLSSTCMHASAESEDLYCFILAVPSAYLRWHLISACMHLQRVIICTASIGNAFALLHWHQISACNPSQRMDICTILLVMPSAPLGWHQVSGCMHF